MADLFEENEIDEFYNNLTDKDLLKILNLGAVLGFSVKERFVISFGRLSDRREHEWLDRKKMMMVDISVFDIFYDEEGTLLVENDPDEEDVRAMLLAGTGGLFIEFDKEFERLSDESFQIDLSKQLGRCKQHF